MSFRTSKLAAAATAAVLSVALGACSNSAPETVSNAPAQETSTKTEIPRDDPQAFVDALPTGEIQEWTAYPPDAPGMTEPMATRAQRLANVSQAAEKVEYGAPNAAEDNAKLFTVETRYNWAAFEPDVNAWKGFFTTAFPTGTVVGTPKTLKREWQLTPDVPGTDRSVYIRTIVAYPVTAPQPGVVVVERSFRRGITLNKQYDLQFTAMNSDECSRLLDGMVVPKSVADFDLAELQSTLNLDVSTPSSDDDHAELRADCLSQRAPIDPPSQPSVPSALPDES